MNSDIGTRPTTWSVIDNIDTYFAIGPLARDYGPQANTSQKFMADKCSVEWDSSCDYLSKNNDILKGNTGRVTTSSLSYNDNYEMSIGDSLVNNSATRRFCNVGQCVISQELYNPLDPSSPMVNNIDCRNIEMVCKPPPNPDKDELMNKLLDKPEKHLNLLVNMYRHTKKDRELYKGTRVGQLFNVMDGYF
jgi:hypothetical protein